MAKPSSWKGFCTVAVVAERHKSHTGVSESCVTGYLVIEVQVVYQLMHCVRVQALHSGFSLKSGLLDASFHHGILNNGEYEGISLCQMAV